MREDNASAARTSEDAAVRQVLLTLRLMGLSAQTRVRNWDDRAEELRLLPRVQCLFESKAESN